MAHDHGERRRREDGSAYAYIFVRQNNEEHLLRSIIDLYVYSTCDYFIYLNARKNSYVMFSGNTAGHAFAAHGVR